MPIIELELPGGGGTVALLSEMESDERLPPGGGLAMLFPIIVLAARLLVSV